MISIAPCFCEGYDKFLLVQRIKDAHLSTKLGTCFNEFSRVCHETVILETVSKVIRIWGVSDHLRFYAACCRSSNQRVQRFFFLGRHSVNREKLMMMMAGMDSYNIRLSPTLTS